MPPKIVFFDIDDTLFRKWQDFMPESVLPAFRALHEAGVLTAIATGRSPCALPAKIRALIDAVGLDILVSTNGQYNRYRGETVAAHPIDPADIAEVVRVCREHDWDYGCTSEEKMALSSDRQRVHDSLYGTVPYETDPDYWQRHPVYQMNVLITAEEEAAFAASGILQRGYQMIRWHPLGMDLLHADGSKARGIRAVCAALGINLADTMAFGDELNDLEMFKTVGFGVAMGDGRDELKALAKYVTTPLEQHGVYNALVHLGIIPGPTWNNA